MERELAWSKFIVVFILALPLMFAGAPSAWADLALDPDLVKAFGGAYSTRCTDPAAPRVRVTSTALIVEHGGDRLVGRDVAFDFGVAMRPQPADFLVGLTASLGGAEKLTFKVFRDKDGAFIRVAGAEAVRTKFGVTTELRSCEPGQQAAVRAFKPDSWQSMAFNRSPSDLMKDRAFRDVYLKALGPKVKEPWLTKLACTAPPNATVEIDGATYIAAHPCQPHACENNLLFIYSPKLKVVYGLLESEDDQRLIGDPPPAIATELERLAATGW